MDKIKRLQELYFDLDKLKLSGEDVVAEIRAEINDLELQILKEDIFPKAMGELANLLSAFRCNVDFSFQYNGKGIIDYSFCKSDSMSLIRDTAKGDVSEVNILPQLLVSKHLKRSVSKQSERNTRNQIKNEIDECNKGIVASETVSKLSPWDFKLYLETIERFHGKGNYSASSISVYTHATRSDYIRTKIIKYNGTGILYDLVDFQVLMNLIDDIMIDVSKGVTSNATLMAIKLYIQMLNDKGLLVQRDDI